MISLRTNRRKRRRIKTGCPEKHGRKAKKGQNVTLDRAHCVRYGIRYAVYFGAGK